MSRNGTRRGVRINNLVAVGFLWKRVYTRLNIAPCLRTMTTSFKCPSFRVPDRSTYLNRSNKRRPDEQSEDSGFNKRSRNAMKQSSYQEQREIMSSIREFGSQALTGMNKKKFKEDKLTKLGAPPPKQQTMPFKMRLGINAGREKRKQKQLELAKESGTVLARPKSSSSTHSKGSRKSKSSRK